MFGNIPVNPLNAEDRELLRLFHGLQAADRRSLMDYLQFLQQRAEAADPAPAGASEAAPVATPLEIPRPENESVVAAIKRLSKAYFMLDRSSLLNEASLLMSAHLLQGRPAPEVIDELERLFAQRYRAHLEAVSPANFDPQD